jgi:hypothetical protein
MSRSKWGWLTGSSQWAGKSMVLSALAAGAMAMGGFAPFDAGKVWAQSDTAEFRPGDQATGSGSQFEGGEDWNKVATPGRGGSGERKGWGAADFAQQKESARAEIELWESRIRRKMTDINAALKGLDLKKIQGQKIAIDSMDELLEEIDGEAKRIIEAKERVAPDLKLYRQALLKAPDVFRKLADSLEKRAETRKSTILKEASADMAAEARKLATSYEMKAKAVDGIEAGIEAKMEFVIESREFIADVRELLSAIPTDHGLQTEKLIDQLNKYVEVFQEAVKTLQGVTQQISEGRSETTPPSPGNSPRVQPSKPLSSSSPSIAPTGALSIADYRTKLAALKR